MLKPNEVKNIAIFASGNGTNADTIIRYFSGHKNIRVCLVLTNNPKAGVISRVEKRGVPTQVFNRDQFYKTNAIVDLLKENKVDLIVLAGFLWLVPSNIIESFPGIIINIHPALLPKFGGKGMYGHHVHEAVIASGEHTSGITIHYVNNKYDDGQIIFKKEIEVLKSDTPLSLAGRIHKIEHEYFPKVIEKLLQKS